jgi:hypothetical protein
MSAKPARKNSAKPTPVPVTAAAVPVPAAVAPTAPAAAPASDSSLSWLESTDPRRRRWGQIVLTAVWVYVAALWLLALDRTFDWGIFGPKIPPLP